MIPLDIQEWPSQNTGWGMKDNNAESATFGGVFRMLMTDFQVPSHKHVLMALFVLVGLTELSFAGPRETQATHEPQTTTIDESSLPAAEPEPETIQVQILDKRISIEDRLRLRRDLYEYSKSVDAAHIQIEERRRLMRKRIQERFLDADHDNDGSLSREEATEMLPQVARHFSQFDLNADGVLTLTELEDARAKAAERQRALTAKIDGQNPDAEANAKRKAGKDAAKDVKEAKEAKDNTNNRKRAL